MALSKVSHRKLYVNAYLIYRYLERRHAFLLPKTDSRRVSVNCFGFGGTNAILYSMMQGAHRTWEASGSPTTYQLLSNKRAHFLRTSEPPNLDSHLFIFSSKSRSGAAELLEFPYRYIEAHCLQSLDCWTTTEVHALLKAFAARLGGSYCCKSVPDLLQKMKALTIDGIVRTCRQKPLRLAYHLCGQGN